MKTICEKNEVVEWLVDKGIIESQYGIEDNRLLNCLSLCIEYYESMDDDLIINESDYLLDESDIQTPLYGDYNFKGKIGMHPTSKQDVVMSIITALIKSSNTPEIHVMLISIVSNLSMTFLSRMVFLPDNYMRCIYLQLLILSKCSSCPVKIDDLEHSLKTGEDADICPFLEFYTCDCLNKEVPNICARKVPLVEILTNLQKLGIITVDLKSNIVFLCNLIR